MRDLGIQPEIEVFDLAMLYNTADLVAEGLILPPPHVQFVFGVKHALPARRDILEFEVAKLRELLPGRPGRPPASGVTSSKWLNGRWSLAGTAGRGWRTTFEWIAIDWRRLMQPWWRGSRTWPQQRGGR
jgi:hypothetical protein